MSLNLTLEQARTLSKNHRVVPVIETLFSGTETPLSIVEKLAGDKPGGFLLESAEQGVWARYSFIGVKNRGMLIQSGSAAGAGEVRWVSATGANALPDASFGALATSAIAAVDQMQRAWATAPIEGVPPLTSGLVGVMGWNLIREIENLPNRPSADFDSPILALAMFEDLVVVDHLTSSLLLVANIFITENLDFDSAYQQSIERIAALSAGMAKPAEAHLADLNLTTEVTPNHRVSKAEYLDSVERAKHFVRIRDVFQVVISQRFDADCVASPLDVYRVLRALNPSPYMYLLNFEDESGPYAVVGSSPEALVKVQGTKAITHPIAGSRPRGADLDADIALADSLLADAKEKSEHLMLVDLARNDLLKVCEPSSVNVTEFMKVERYSHIMHLVSTVEGRVRDDQSAVDVFKATFPAGTLSGAPKPRALEIIDELEVADRGVYGGVVGYFDFAGNADLAIAIRSAFIRDGRAYVQAGAGLVLDSIPESEYLETVAKAGAPMRAVFAANDLAKAKIASLAAEAD
jgi:anthranilate synthase component 1